MQIKDSVATKEYRENGQLVTLFVFNQATMERIMKSLPDVTMAALQIGISYTLSAFSPNEVNNSSSTAQ